MRLSLAMLRKVVLEEAAKLNENKFGKMKDVEDAPAAEEVEADGYADTLEQKIDHMKALKIKENRLKARLRRLEEQRAAIKGAIVKKL